MMFAVSAHEGNTDFAYDEGCMYKQFGTWRKHPYLQGWMERLFNIKADAQGFEGITEFNNDVVYHTTEAPEGWTPDENTPVSNSMDEIQKQVMQEQFAASATNLHKKRQFNRQCIRLNTGDLDQLEMAVKLGELPPTKGFFFGDDASEHYKEYDLEMIEVARKAINFGLNVYYDSWW